MIHKQYGHGLIKNLIKENILFLEYLGIAGENHEVYCEIQTNDIARALRDEDVFSVIDVTAHCKTFWGTHDEIISDAKQFFPKNALLEEIEEITRCCPQCGSTQKNCMCVSMERQ